jgi:TPP-dependent pyruvate/acetoin dehydrogenase alpha subunit
MLEKRLAEQKMLSPAQAQKVHDEIQAEVDAAMAAAEAAPLPDVSALLEDVYA